MVVHIKHSVQHCNNYYSAQFVSVSPSLVCSFPEALRPAIIYCACAQECQAVDMPFMCQEKWLVKPRAPITMTRSRRRLERQKRKMGIYECEFVEHPPKHLQSECPICLQILREPHLISCCGHSYCEACIERVGKDGKPCPLCNEPGFTRA